MGRATEMLCCSRYFNDVRPEKVPDLMYAMELEYIERNFCSVPDDVPWEWQIFQRSEARENTRFERCEGVGKEVPICTNFKHKTSYFFILCCSRDANDPRPENVPDSIDVIALEFK